jgi:AcrR family transcriptional regulator
MAEDKPHGREEIVEAVMEAAIPLIAQRGPLAVSLRDIAAAANVNTALIIRHFGSKEKMLARISDHVGTKALRHANAGTQGLDATWEAIIRNQSVELRAMARLLLDSEPNPDEVATSRILNQAREWFAKELHLSAEIPEESSLAVYVAACLVIGSEVVGSHLLTALGVPPERFLDARIRAFRTVLGTLLTGQNHDGASPPGSTVGPHD